MQGRPERQVREERSEELPMKELEVIRDALRQSTEVNSLRFTARELGMSPTGLRGLIDGTAPYGKTIRKLRAWYAEWARREGVLDVADAKAIEVLTGTIREDRRAEAADAIRQLVEKYRRGD